MDELVKLDFTLVPTFTISEASRDLIRAALKTSPEVLMPGGQRKGLLRQIARGPVSESTWKLMTLPPQR